MPPLDSNIHDADPSVTEQNAPGWIVPKWAMQLACGFVGAALPTIAWAGWVTWSIVAIDNTSANLLEATRELQANIATLQTSRENHAMQMQAIAATAQQANALNQGTLAEIRAVAKDMQSLQRDFDRTLGKVRAE